MSKKPKILEIYIRNSLSEEDFKKIRIFLKRAREIAKTHIISGSTGTISLKANLRIGKTVKFAVILPDEEYLRSFYMAFRFFYLKKEPSNFLKIANIIKRKTNNPLAKKYIDQLKDMWSGALARQQIQIIYNDIELTPTLLMDLWFNSHYFHSDVDKDKKLLEIKNVLTIDVCRVLLADAVYEATKAVFKLARALRSLET